MRNPNEKSFYWGVAVSFNPNYVLELRDEPLKYNRTGTYRDEA